jgi:hypothetical protein
MKMTTKIEREREMVQRCESVLLQLQKSQGRRLGIIACGLPYSDDEVKAALNRLWREGLVSRHLNCSHGNFRYYQWYLTEKAAK